MFHLNGKHILIIGGSRGIGAAIVKKAVELGANVSFTYANNQKASDQLIENMPTHAYQMQSLKTNILDKNSIVTTFEKAIDKFGEINGLVITAGIFEPSKIEEMTESFWDNTIDTNLKGTFLSVQAAIPSLRKTKGSIVIYSSTAGQRGSDIYSAYATSKGAQLLFMRSTAKELAPDKIRCNCVAPGWTETNMATDTINKLGREEIIASIPLGRIGLPEDAAAPALFLLSDAAQFITGSTITVDGGFDMRG